MSTNAPDSRLIPEESEPSIDRITADWYKTSSLADIVSSVDVIPFPPTHIPEAVADGSVSRVVFARICNQNPRIAVRYADGRLVKRTEDGNGLDYFLISKRGTVELHVHHVDETGSWIRDVYEVDAMGNAKFVSYVTEENESKYYADLDLASAHGHMEDPKFSDYVGYVPPTVHDPVSKVWSVRAAVGRIIDAVRL